MVHNIVTELSDKRKMKTGFSIKGKERKMLFSADDVSCRWEEYIKELYSDNDRAMNKPTVLDCTTGPEIMEAEVDAAIKALRFRKAAGRDSICAELLKFMRERGLKELTCLCQSIYNSFYIPKDLTQSVFITIPKKPGATNCSDFRTISVISQVKKVLLKIIPERIREK